MARRRITSDQLASAVMEELEKYTGLTTDAMKAAVTDAGQTVLDEIRDIAPKRTGQYAQSWKVKKTRETDDALEVTVYSPTHYRLTHLLEHGHAKRGGGRVRAIPHIAPAEEKGEKRLMEDIEKAVKG